MERISTHQFLMLGAGVTLGTTFFPVGMTVASSAGRDGWMAVIPAFLFGIPFSLMLLSLAEKYPQKNLIQITEQVLGKWMGKIFGILAILISIYFGGLLARQGVDMFSRSILPLIPFWAFLLSGFVLVLMLVNAGIEVMARFCEIVFPIVAVALIGTALLSIPRFEQGELLPFLENGFKPVLFGVIEIIPWPMEFVLFLGGLLKFLPQGQQEIRQMRAKVWHVLLFVGLLNMLITLVEIWVFGPTEATRLTYGLLTLGKMIEISQTVSGIESIFTVIWMGASLIKVSAFYFLGLWGVQTVFGLKRGVAHMFIIPIMSVIPWTLTRGADLQIAITQADRYLILPLALVWVILLWGVSWWRQRK
ncbi:endospore germination permease [Desulfitobacterium sp.]|uniref:GerAB/ArcD/ProY family transporter n=1 Tax=Desulfitobacterium sp. TaxID=49981 RepID=UPI002C7A54FC|nr:endospore germination permease [Desulfitobacterium sp.]HVJ50716.1 endospore germination permease [Desulfitobacterium sp.]